MTLCICIPTKARAKQLRDLLESLAPYVRVYGGNVSLFVADQSDEETFAVNANVIARFSDESGSKTFHWGKTMGRSDPRLECVYEMTLPVSRGGYGANRNRLLLAAAGARCVFIDDDVVLKPACFRSLSDASSLAAGEIGWRLWPRRGGATVISELREMDLLGTLVQDLGRQFNERYVRVSSPGVYGDTGLATHGSVPFELGVVPESVLSDRRDFDLLRTGRDAIRQAAARSVTGPSGLLTTIFGLDSTRLVPPFVPTGRGEDEIWGIVCRKIEPDIGVAHMPWAVKHVGRPARKALLPDLGSSTLWVVFSIDMFETRRDSSIANLVALGEHLSVLGSLPLWRYVREVCSHATAFAAAEVERLKQKVDVCIDRPWLLSHLSRLLLEWERLHASLAEGRPLTVIGKNSLWEAQYRCARLAQVIRCWPTQWEFATRESLVESGDGRSRTEEP